MATFTTKPQADAADRFAGTPDWPRAKAPAQAIASSEHSLESSDSSPSQRDALHALLSFSALHEQVRRRKALAAQPGGFDGSLVGAEFEDDEQLVLDQVLHLVAERAVAITGADGIAIALAERDEIVLRAAAGTVRPDVGARIDRDSAFSGACFRQAQVATCDDTEVDTRVNLEACRKLGARSMVAVPLCGRRRVIGVLEAFSTWPFGFNDSDVRNLTLLAELILGALKPEDEERFAQSAQRATTKFAAPAKPAESPRVVTVSVASAVPAHVASATAAPTIKIKTLESASAVDTHIDAAKQIETIRAIETAPQPALTFGQVEPERKTRPATVILLLFIVVAAAFAGGVWWKLKTAQLGSVMVHTEKVAPRPSVTPTKPANQDEAQAVTDSATPTASDTIDNAAPGDAAAASAQELAKFPRVTGIRHWSSADSSTVVLDLEDQVQYEAHRIASPDRIYFDLHDTQLAPDLSGKSIDVGDALLNRVRVAQPVAGMTRIVLETRANSNFSVSLEPNPYRLIVEVRKPGTAPKAVNLFPNADAEKRLLAIVVPSPTREDLSLRARVPKMKIVIDAGHGGWDLGTVGRRGLLEKDLVLEIATRLGKLLESRLGAEIVYTRPDDNYVTLDDRAMIANQAQADLFVSVHANYSDLPSARGVETYYTNFFTAPGAKEADAHANASAKKAFTPTLSAADLHERIEQSRRLAVSVQRSLYGTLSAENPGLRDRGTKEAGFVVLTESAMPGILAEVSFVSSPTDEQKLRSNGYREEIAEALYRGVARYAASSKSVRVAAK